MGRIQQLPHTVISQIAAGEVIERPASVVKELLENAIDAGGSRIEVDVEQGGLSLIQVVDNGCGIPADDLPLAFASHATSKLQTAADLFRVGTFGFRGEALASIGGVAQVRLQSRPPEQTCGSEITCHGGELSPVRTWNGSAGTRTEVRHLFYNTPVRRKFLRGPSTEMARINETFTRLALSPRAPGLTLRHNGKLVHEVSLSADPLERALLLFGEELRDALYPVAAREGELHVEGYVADPACERAGAGMQFLYVNGRWVRDRSLSQALLEAYRGLLMTGRQPVALLYLDLPADEVDVNVHPAKAEVRFHDAEAVCQLVQEAVLHCLRSRNLTARLKAPANRGVPPENPQESVSKQSGRASVSRVASPPEAVLLPFADRSDTPPTPAPADPTTPSPLALPEQPRVQPPVEQASLKALQLHDLYLVVEVPEGMLVLDQHALHERILFEQLKERLCQGKLEAQRLLIPEPVQLSGTQAALVLEQRDALAELALGVEDFGGGTVLLSSYPALLGKHPPRAILQAVAEHLATREKAPSREALFNDLLSLVACHSAVRAGDRLNQEEIAALLAQRELALNSHHCPHGRPTSLLFNHRELERQFRRR